MIFSARLSAPARSSWNDLGLGISTSLASIQFTSSAAIPANIDEAEAQDVQAIIHAMRYIASSAAMPLTIDKSTRRKPKP